MSEEAAADEDEGHAEEDAAITLSAVQKARNSAKTLQARQQDRPVMPVMPQLLEIQGVREPKSFEDLPCPYGCPQVLF